ncbi:MAG: hypothetical protein DRH70_06310, partial [Candidatus Coatesbacteria bacterium]
MSRAVLACVVIALFALLPIAAIAGPTIWIYTDAETYDYGDTIEVSLAALNLGNGMSVDLYVGLLTPDGGLYTLSPYGVSGWSGNIEAWIPDIYVPPDFSMIRTPLFWFDVPSSMPPIGNEGEYNFASVLTGVGNFDQWVCNASLAPFEILAEGPGGHFYVNATSGDNGNNGLSADEAWKTITHALEQVEGLEDYPATIHVAAGTYASSTNGETFPLNMKSYVSLIGDSPDKTILDAEGTTYHVIYCNGVNNLTIEGFTITGGKAHGRLSSPDSSGGGVYCYNSSPTVENNTITDNSAHYGGGICCQDSTPTISNNTIRGNGGISTYYGTE